MDNDYAKYRVHPLFRRIRSGKLRPENKITFDYNKLFVTDEKTNTVVHVSKVNEYIKFKSEGRKDSKCVSPVKSYLTTASAPGLLEASPISTSATQHDDIEKDCSYRCISNFTVYKHMQPQSIVISVEHCHCCDDHPMSLRHKEQEYLEKAESILRYLAERVHSCYPCVQVGVLRVPASVDRKCDNGLERTGALEIQIAYASADCNQRQNHPDVELLHSKLSTRRWPSRVVLEKRLRSFLSRQHTLKYFHHVPGAASSRNAAFSWYTCPLANPNWKSKPPVDKNNILDSDVTWVFDYRACGLIGSIVEVSQHLLQFTPLNCVENTVEFTGRVVGVERDVGTEDWVLLVIPRFADQYLACPMSKCRPWQYRSRRLHCTDAEMWTVLRIVMEYANYKRSEPWKWELLCGDDYIEDLDCDGTGESEIRLEGGTRDVWLSPPSYYRQVGTLAWEIVLARQRSASSTAVITSTATGDGSGASVKHVQEREQGCVDETVPVQMVYSEEAMDWLFGQSAFVKGGLVNVTKLSKHAYMQPQFSHDSGSLCSLVAGVAKSAVTPLAEQVVLEALSSALDLYLYNQCGE